MSAEANELDNLHDFSSHKCQLNCIVTNLSHDTRTGHNSSGAFNSIETLMTGRAQIFTTENRKKFPVFWDSDIDFDKLQNLFLEM